MKTVLYDEKAIINFQMFGIEIPAYKSRQERTLEALLKNKELINSKDKWLCRENPYSIKKEDLKRIHSEKYLSSLFSDELENCLMKAFELINSDGTFNRYNPENEKAPLTELFNQVLRMSAGTYFSAREALETGFCYFMGGGMHHGHKDFGHGFCPTNDIMTTAKRICSEKLAETIWIIDVDAHKGDGTAEIAQNDDNIKTLSIHMAQGWPLDAPEYNKQGVYNKAYSPSDIDIPINKGEEDSYTEKMRSALNKLEFLSGQIKKPDLAIILLGVDPFEKDQLLSTSSLNLSEEQILERDKVLYNFLNSRKIPAAYTMAGGYGEYSWKAHYNFLYWVLTKD